jgi:hypothetical protein
VGIEGRDGCRFHLNRIATASAFAIRFKCKGFLPAGKTRATGNGRRPAGERPSFDLRLLGKKEEINAVASETGRRAHGAPWAVGSNGT